MIVNGALKRGILFMNEGWGGVGVRLVRLELGEDGKDVGGDGFAGLGRVHGDLFLEALRFAGASPLKGWPAITKAVPAHTGTGGIGPIYIMQASLLNRALRQSIDC